MNLKIAAAACLLTPSCSNFEGVNFKGDTNFSHSSETRIETRFSAEKSTLIFEPPSKKWEINLKNKINFDHDHFGKEIKTNIFSTIGVDF